MLSATTTTERADYRSTHQWLVRSTNRPTTGTAAKAKVKSEEKNCRNKNINIDRAAITKLNANKWKRKILAATTKSTAPRCGDLKIENNQPMDINKFTALHYRLTDWLWVTGSGTKVHRLLKMYILFVALMLVCSVSVKACKINTIFYAYIHINMYYIYINM